MIIKGEGGIEAECLLKTEGLYAPLITLRVRFPRFVAEQFLKHRMFSCNAVSSRAMSVPKMNRWIQENPSKPLFWGAQVKGMQPQEECNNLIEDIDTFGTYIGFEGSTREEAWEWSKTHAMATAQAFWEAGYHQQIPNRLTHAFQMAEYIVTATDWSNFFNLRLHDKAAQCEITELARCIEKAIDSAPLSHGEWHLPMLTLKDRTELSLEDMLILSAARCAVISYNNHNTGGLMTLEGARRLFEHLISDTNPHLTPCEHQARVPTEQERTILKLPSKSYVSCNIEPLVRKKEIANQYFANFYGWISHRYLLEMREL